MAPQRLVVGRQAERAALRTAADAVAAGEYRLVQVSGEPGIGKTRMLSWLAGYAHSRDLPVLVGGAAEFETDVPFGPLVAAIEPRIAMMRDELRDRLSEDRYRLAGTVFPGLTAHPRDGERYRLHRALRSLLEAITPASGLVVCLDDLHWADPATCDFLAHLVRHPLQAPVLLVLAYRPRQQPARLADALRGTPSTHVALGPLSRAETAELAGVAVGSARGTRLFEAGGGNPLYTELLASSWAPDELAEPPTGAVTRQAPRPTMSHQPADAPPECATAEPSPAPQPAMRHQLAEPAEPPEHTIAEPSPAPQPATSHEPAEAAALFERTTTDRRPAPRPTMSHQPAEPTALFERTNAAASCPVPTDSSVGDLLVAAFGRELRGLGAIERTVLESAAVVGDEFDPNLVAAIARRPVGDVLGALDRLAARDLVRAAPTEPRLKHRHPLLRRAAYLGSDPDWRLTAHRRAWAVLVAQGAPAATVARHVARSASVGDRAGIDVLLAAADATSVSAPASCARWLSVALSLLPDDQSTVDERVSLLTMRAKALGMAGRFAPARAAVLAALGLLPRDAGEQRASATAYLAMIERRLGRFDAAREMLVAELAGRNDAVLLFELALGGLLSATPDQPWAERAVVAARALGDPAQTAAALAVLVLHDLIRGRWTTATRDRVREAVARTDGLTDGQLAARLDAAVWVGWCELSLDRFVDAARHLERGLALARTTGQDHLVGYLRAGLATAYASLGRLDAAAERVTDAVDNGAELAGIALAQRGWIEAWRGNLAEATDIVDRLDGHDDTSGMFAAQAGALAALVRHVAGDSAGCVDRLLRAGGGRELSNLDGSSRVCWYQLLAEAEVTAGRPERAKAWAAKAQWAAEAMPLPRKQAFAALAWGWARSTSDAAGAAAVAERAARMFGELADRVLQGRALLLAGQCRAAAGDTEAAKRLLADAERVFTGCGAAGFADQAARARRRPGRRTAAMADDPLTERERAVATLVAEGRTNREVASALYLSARTVEAHLTRVYAKLGLSSRSELASQVRS